MIDFACMSDCSHAIAVAGCLCTVLSGCALHWCAEILDDAAHSAHRYFHKQVLSFLRRHIYVDAAAVDVSALLRRQLGAAHEHALHRRSRHRRPAPRRLVEPRWLQLTGPNALGESPCGCEFTAGLSSDDEEDSDSGEAEEAEDEGELEENEEDEESEL
jgi:hypothetical protein